MQCIRDGVCYEAMFLHTLRADLSVPDVYTRGCDNVVLFGLSYPNDWFRNPAARSSYVDRIAERDVACLRMWRGFTPSVDGVHVNCVVTSGDPHGRLWDLGVKVLVHDTLLRWSWTRSPSGYLPLSSDGNTDVETESETEEDAEETDDDDGGV